MYVFVSMLVINYIDLPILLIYLRRGGFDVGHIPDAWTLYLYALKTSICVNTQPIAGAVVLPCGALIDICMQDQEKVCVCMKASRFSLITFCLT